MNTKLPLLPQPLFSSDSPIWALFQRWANTETQDQAAKAAERIEAFISHRMQSYALAYGELVRAECERVAGLKSTGWVAPKDRYVVPILFDPYNGEPRDARDIQSDPQGVLIAVPGAYMEPAKPTPPLGNPVQAEPVVEARGPDRQAFELRMLDFGWRNFEGSMRGDPSGWYYDNAELNFRWIGWREAMLSSAPPAQEPQPVLQTEGYKGVETVPLNSATLEMRASMALEWVRGLAVHSCSSHEKDCAISTLHDVVEALRILTRRDELENEKTRAAHPQPPSAPAESEWADFRAAFVALSGLLGQVEEFVSEHGEANFETGEALAAVERCMKYDDKFGPAPSAPADAQPPTQQTSAHVAPTQAAVDERAEFEKWLKRREGPQGDEPGYPGPTPFHMDERYAAFEGWAARAALAPQQADAQPSQAAKDVLAERQRQISVDGWTPEHDDEHDKGVMSAAAACYALHTEPIGNVRDYLRFWPWDASWWKPGDRRRNLIKAGALILAEIERLDRAAPSTSGEQHGNE